MLTYPDLTDPIDFQYQHRRQACQNIVRELGGLLGYERAIKILTEALEDPNRKDVVYHLQIIPRPTPPTPPAQPPFPAVQTPLHMQSPDRKLRDAAKDIAKESLKEYKSEITAGIEEIQKEMIKLCRDVSIHAMNKN